MDPNEPSEYVDKIVLEILGSRSSGSYQRCGRRVKKLDLTRFDATLVAATLLREYSGVALVHGQQVAVWHDEQRLRFCVRDLIHGSNDQDRRRSGGSTIEFVRRIGTFSEIKWLATAVSRLVPKAGCGEPSSASAPRNRPSEESARRTSDRTLLADGIYSTEHVEIVNRSASMMVSSDHSPDRGDALAMVSASTGKQSSSRPLSQDLGAHQPILDSQGSVAGRSRSSNGAADDECLFRSSIYVRINPMNSVQSQKNWTQ